MKLDDEYLDEMAACLVPILDELASRGFSPPKGGTRYEKLRADYRKQKVTEDPGFWEAVKTSTGIRIQKLEEDT